MMSNLEGRLSKRPLVSDDAPERGDTIVVFGYNLVDDLIGQVSFAEVVGRVLWGKSELDHGCQRVLDALLVTFMDHGVTPSSLAARLTLLGAPEAIQGAVAAGLSGAGSRYLGTMELTAGLLKSALENRTGSESLAAVADSIVDAYSSSGRPIPGLGHPEHKYEDPRVPRLLELADEYAVIGAHTNLLVELQHSVCRSRQLILPLNAAGVAGALVLDMGGSAESAKGIALIARAAGLVGQLLDELTMPQAQAVWDRERRRSLSPASGDKDD